MESSLWNYFSACKPVLFAGINAKWAWAWKGLNVNMGCCGCKTDPYSSLHPHTQFYILIEDALSDNNNKHHIVIAYRLSTTWYIATFTLSSLCDSNFRTAIDPSVILIDSIWGNRFIQQNASSNELCRGCHICGLPETGLDLHQGSLLCASLEPMFMQHSLMSHSTYFPHGLAVYLHASSCMKTGTLSIQSWYC